MQQKRINLKYWWPVVLLMLMPVRSFAQEPQVCAVNTPASTTGEPTPPNKCDEREDFEIIGYFGMAIDTFAAEDLKKYLNPEDSGELRRRGVGGFDFSYRMTSVPKPGRWPKQLWVFGETIHGVRSADVDCAGDNAKIPPCKDAFAGAQLAGNLVNPGAQTLYMLRNATSLEAFMGMRYEFLTLQTNSKSRANLYFIGQAGFLTVAKNGQDVVDLHEYGVGLVATTGPFTGSHLEIGRGRSDIFRVHRRSRTKFDGFATWKVGGSETWHGIQPFIQIAVDADLGFGADSVQSYFGLQFDVRKLFKSQ